MIKYFNITASGHNIRCKLWCTTPREISSLVLFVHGFGGHKDNKAAERFAQKVLSKGKTYGVLIFDLPAHGDDVKKKISLSDCDTYLTMVLDHIRQQIQVTNILANAASFGGYLLLKYLADHGNPFRKLVLRCPAIPMHEVLTHTIMTADMFPLLEKGKDISVGFDRKIRLDKAFLQELREQDIQKIDYLDYAEDILVIHGTADEVVPFEAVREFADNNLIEFLPVERADHRFCNLTHMDLAIARTIEFLELG